MFLIVMIPVMTGCVRNTAAPVPAEGPAEAGTVMTETGSTMAEEDLAAEYFYMKSRRLANKGNTEAAIDALESAIAKDPDSSFLKRDLIVLLHKLKRSDQALALAKKLAEQDPDNVENLMLLVQLKRGGEYDREMSDLLKKILELDPENQDTYLRLGKIYLDTEAFDDALDLFTKMTQAFPDNYVAYFYLGESYLNKGKTAKAVTAFEKTLELAPDLAEPRFRLADIYQGTGSDKGRDKNKAKILKLYKEILELQPDNDRAMMELALFYYQDNQMDKADPLFARLSQAMTENPRMIMTAVDTFISRKRYNEAVIVFTQLRKLDPSNANLNFFLGMAHEALDQTDKAIEFYLKVPPDHPQYKKTILSIAFLYRDKGNIREALRFLEQHHNQSPADIDIISYLASFYEEDTRYDTAITLLQEGLKKSPENTTLLFKLGTIQDKAGQRQACINTMKALIRLDPNHASALNYLGYTYAEMDIHLDEALDLIKRALDIRPDDGYITDSLGWVYYKKGDYEKAVFHLEKAARISEFETVIASHLGDAYLKTGQPDKAMAAYQKALANADADTHKKEIKDIKQKIKAIKAGEKALD
ncbi:MAG: tetratricopeptide repeat protein [Desulfobacterales bacterium]|nr:tetratricopeptide repeat protein [Desulfobacterales bacterium]